MLIGLGAYETGMFARSPIAQQFVAQNPVLPASVSPAVRAALAPATTLQKNLFAARSVLPAAPEGMPLWKKAAIGAAIALPLGYFGFRYVKARRAKASQ